MKTEIEIRENPRRMVLFWVSDEEARDSELMASLEPQFEVWNKRQYQPVVFASGAGYSRRVPSDH